MKSFNQRLLPLLMMFAVALSACTATEMSRYRYMRAGHIPEYSAGDRRAKAAEVTSTRRVVRSAAPTPAAMVRNSRAEDMVKQLSQQARERKTFRFKFVDEFDDIQPDGRRI